MSDATSISNLPTNQEMKNEVTLETREIFNKKTQPPPQLNNKEMQNLIGNLQSAKENNITSLPSRDIPQETLHMMHDQRVKQNFVEQPPPQRHVDYVQQYNQQHQVKTLKEEEKKKIATVYDELQTPLFVALLFFVFQMPFFTKLMIKFVPSLFSQDANPSLGGYVAKSLLFGVMFYVMQKSTDYFSEI